LNYNHSMHQTPFSFLITFLFSSIILSASLKILILISNSWVISSLCPSSKNLQESPKLNWLVGFISCF
jgi:hypothetical protein